MKETDNNKAFDAHGNIMEGILNSIFSSKNNVIAGVDFTPELLDKVDLENDSHDCKLETKGFCECTPDQD